MTARVYLDSNIIIYYVEGVPLLQTQVDAVLKGYIAASQGFVTSEITLGECLIGMGRKSSRDQRAFLSVLDDPSFVWLEPVSSAIIRRGAQLGTDFNMKLVDSIHVATAEALRCSVFLTNDRGIRAPAGIELRYLSVTA